MDINKKVLNEVSKGAKMGMDAIKFVSDKVSDSRFQRVLNVEYLKYKEIFNRVGNIYHNYDLTDDPQETNIMNKAMTWYGIQMNTMTDKSNSNISESYNSYFQSEYIYDTNFFTRELETFTALTFLSDGNKIFEPRKFQMLPYFKN